MGRILLIEDETHLAAFIKKGLSEEQYDVVVAPDGISGLEMALQHEFDLIILDIMLPGTNGLAICKELRSQNIATPLLFLTALGATENVVMGLNSGADDYLIKPFKFAELLARVKSLMRRKNAGLSGTVVQETSTYTIADLEVDDLSKVVKRGGTVISLTATEYRLLLLFLKSKRKVLSRSEILEQVWSVDFNMGTNVVDVYVNYLRKKIDKNSGNKLIHTMVGMGYVMKESNENAN